LGVDGGIGLCPNGNLFGGVAVLVKSIFPSLGVCAS
jgi:hypothetical protein